MTDGCFRVGNPNVNDLGDFFEEHCANESNTFENY